MLLLVSTAAKWVLSPVELTQKYSCCVLLCPSVYNWLPSSQSKRFVVYYLRCKVPVSFFLFLSPRFIPFTSPPRRKCATHFGMNLGGCGFPPHSRKKFLCLLPSTWFVSLKFYWEQVKLEELVGCGGKTLTTITGSFFFRWPIMSNLWGGCALFQKFSHAPPPRILYPGNFKIFT